MGCYEEANSAAAKYYLTYQEMKNDFLNMTTVWLFYLFEKDCNKIFTNKKWSGRKAKLTNLSISIIKPSTFYKINEELQHICDINKHGDGRAKVKLLDIRSDLFETKSFSSELTLKNISLEQLKEYAENMKSFWIELYNQVQLNPKFVI